MKPPKNLVPQGDDNGRKSAGRGFGGDDFRNYMARKIELQRKQFGLELPPDPRERADLDDTTGSSAETQNKRKGARVRFSSNVETFEFRCEQPPSKKRKKYASSRNRGPLTVLERLQHKHEKEQNTQQPGSPRKRPHRKSKMKVIEKVPPDIGDSGSSEDAAHKHVDTIVSQIEAGGSVDCSDSGDSSVVTDSGNKAIQHHTATSPKRRPDLFFYGVVVLVNGYTDPDAGTIQRMIQRHGGDLEKYETSRVTHIIAEHLSNAKANMYKRQRRPTPVCRPQWIVDCVESFRLLPFADYLLDEVLDDDVGRKTVKSFFTSPQDNNDRDTVHSDTSCNSGTTLQLPRQEQENGTRQEGKGGNGILLSTKETAISEPPVQLGSVQPPAALEHVDKAAATRRFVMKPEIKTDTLAPHSENEKKKSSLAKADSPAFAGRVRTTGTRTTGTDPNFLDSYFNSSRLSFIGSFKQRSKQSPTKKHSKGIENPDSSRRFVFHVDMDCFFASVVLRNFPEHRNKPVAISHCGGDAQHASKYSTSECATCNYEARKYGIKKGMFLGRARELCPDLVVLKYDFDGYEEVSEQVADILHRHSELYNGGVEQVSCDEAYMELFIPLDGEARSTSAIVGDIAETIRSEIFSATHCTASIGVAENKLLARLATNRAKPDKSLVVENFRDILSPLRLRDLPGIGYKKERELNAEGIVTVRDVWELGDQAEAELNRILGKLTGKKISLFCNGVDDTPVKAALRKSIGAECNYGVRFDGPYGVHHMMSGLAKEVQKRMEHVGVRGSRLTLKVKQRKKGAKPPPKFLGHGSCHNYSKSSNVEVTNDWRVLSRIGMALFEDLGIPKDDVRGMGLVVSRLDNGGSTAVSSDTRGGIANFLLSVKDTQTSVMEKERSQSNQHNDDAATKMSKTDNSTQVCKTVSSVVTDTSIGGTAAPTCSQIEVGILDELPSHTREDVVLESDGELDSLTHPGNVIVIDGIPTSPTIQDHQERAGHTQNQSAHILEGSPGNGSVSSDNDVALPPLSQIHMSQVMALPSPLRNQVISKMQSSPRHGQYYKQEFENNRNSGAPSKKVTRSPEDKKREIAVFGEESSRLRQVSVKRMMKLAAVKNGDDTLSANLGESVSLTQLESLPLELQLQVANNDDFHIGVLSPSKRRVRGPVATHLVTIEECVDKEEDSSSCDPKTLAEVEDMAGASGEIEAAHKVSCSFYEDHILPLREWMDAHPNPSIDGVGLMKDFLSVVISENRIDDAIKMLRSIRDRNDEWSTPPIYNEQLLRSVVEEYRQASFGGILDTKWLRLS